MKKNVIILVPEGLSKWYIDQAKTEKSFFGKLEKNSYCCNQMFSGAPFTEASMGELFASEETLKNVNYLSKCRGFSNDPFYKIFKENGYYTYLSDIEFINTSKYSDNQGVKRSDYRDAAFWQYENVFETFIRIYSEGKFGGKDYWKMRYGLECYFKEFSYIDEVREEENIYKQDSIKYINDLLINKQNSSFFVHCIPRALWDKHEQETYTNFRSLLDDPISDAEAMLLTKMTCKDKEFLLNTNKGNDEKKSVIKDVAYNSNIHDRQQILLKNRYTRVEEKGIRQGLGDFIDWYDQEGRQLDRPFMAYIHSMHYHEIDRFVDSTYGEKDAKDAYEQELTALTKRIDGLQWKKMSVSRQLMIEYVEKNLESFWNALHSRGLFDNTIVVLTTNFGSRNFLLHDAKDSWNYRRTVFNIPFYMVGPGITNQEDNKLMSARDVLPTLIEECELDKKSNQYIGTHVKHSDSNFLYTAWVNGTPDFDRCRITCGIRNDQYSITCMLHPTQFLETGKIMGVYDLKNDPDECVNLAPDVSAPAVRELFDKLKEKWFDTVMMIWTDEDNQWAASKRYRFLKEKEEYYRNISKSLKKENWSKLDELAKGKEIIIFGAGLHTEKLLTDNRFTYLVKEIWDNDPRKAGTYMLGNRISLPDSQKITEDTFLIVTSRFEFEIVEQLERMGIKQYVFGGQYINGFLE